MIGSDNFDRIVKKQKRLRSLAARCARVFLLSCPSVEAEGAGKTGCRPAPMAHCAQNAQAKCTAGEPQVKPETPGLPCAVGLRLTSRSPRGDELCCPRRLADC